ncbi:MAG: hypothetical protein LBE13_19905 [Bacteroidales bacterium]|jgi:nitrogen regulatory protein PII|nr:hypothetical protein [Bacteroidales bacterium]
MKAVFIAFSQTNTERVEYLLDRLNIRGYTFWENVQGCGTVKGEPHRGTHTWPEMNSAMLVMVEDEKVPEILQAVKKLSIRNDDVGVRAFVWTIEQSV